MQDTCRRSRLQPGYWVGIGYWVFVTSYGLARRSSGGFRGETGELEAIGDT